MKNLKALVLSALVATTTLVAGATGAQASGYSCYTNTSNNRVCVYDVRGNRYEKEYKMQVNGRYAGTYYVDCGITRGVNRYNYKENANGIVCFEFG